MNTPLESPYQSPMPNTQIAYVLRVVESVALFLFFMGILFKLQAWPYADVLWGVAMVVLGIAYGVLFPVRLKGLKLALGKDYFPFLAAGLSLCLAFGIRGLTMLIFEVYYAETLFTVFDVVKVLGIVGIVISLFYFIVKGPGQPNTLYYAIVSWLRIRLILATLWMGGGLLIGLAIRQAGS